MHSTLILRLSAKTKTKQVKFLGKKTKTGLFKEKLGWGQGKDTNWEAEET